jgi:hypothetical protein
MKATLEFSLPEDQDEFKNAVDGWKYKSAMDDVWDELFRPRWKHGYSDQTLEDLRKNESVETAIDMLEKMYKEIMDRHA